MSLSAAFEWKLADMWVGVFWKKEYVNARPVGGEWKHATHCVHVWICILPCIPLHVRWWTTEKEARP